MVESRFLFRDFPLSLLIKGFRNLVLKTFQNDVSGHLVLWQYRFFRAESDSAQIHVWITLKDLLDLVFEQTCLQPAVILLDSLLHVLIDPINNSRLPRF